MLDDRTTLRFPDSGVARLGFVFTPQLVRCLAAGPGGHPLYVLLDTGTDPSAIDLRLARRLALPTGGDGLGQGAASDTVAFTEAVLPWLRLGDATGGALTIRDLFAPAIDLSTLPFQVDVVLGYNVLRQLTLQIDYRQQQLVLAHPDLGLPALSPHGQRLPLTFFEHFPALAGLIVDGQPIGLATIDTGSNAALSLGPVLAAQLGVLADAAGVTYAQGAGFGGDAQLLQSQCRQVQLGRFVLHDIALDTQIAAVGDLGRPARANIGNRLLARFASVGLDYGRGLLTLEP